MKPLIKGGQGRKLDESDAWTLWVLALAALFIGLLGGCCRERVFSEAPGDALPPPVDAQTRQYVEGAYPEVGRVSQAESERKMRGLRRMVNGND